METCVSDDISQYDALTDDLTVGLSCDKISKTSDCSCVQSQTGRHFAQSLRSRLSIHLLKETSAHDEYSQTGRLTLLHVTSSSL